MPSLTPATEDTGTLSAFTEGSGSLTAPSEAAGSLTKLSFFTGARCSTTTLVSTALICGAPPMLTAAAAGTGTLNPA